MSETITVSTPEETMTIGQTLADLLQANDLLLLDGDLGAGKTTFTKGLALGLGIHRNIKSPTFTIIREYQEGRLPLYHMDVYRLEEGGGDELGLEEYFNGDGVSVVEWSTFVADELPDDYLKISFKRLDNEGSTIRQLHFEAHGDHFEQVLMTLMERLNHAK
ncbi:tRNA (adenosine(37)-N6)-threonylcarbamoyltransferase complex ATPase subunit type 1 TsaE [Secundilactobacillus kimchicus]|uniref:tRNA threonylcarbamoyladenosine biosynthesis protein TsaE n=1 Tax=Secundilactobacillus kimchicus JCM 15530 TaxID=1302272 RepID=A0A0R1HYV5_9LACO|nr:tRNA (adenosine(37)-N6)-threonylcarbamoyltransferase complex ATPase subunit type 1 TsaE [Secundilactobacillus kimchicus]KRK48103.1 hypothetical protein FC96_GL001834 [Secundilactobacillus kimchicus JCM 15530]